MLEENSLNCNLSLKEIEVLEDICVHVIDSKGFSLYYSKGCEKTEGYKREDVLGKHVTEIYWTSDKEKLNFENSIIIKALETKQCIKNNRTKFLTKHGELINVISSAYPIFSEGEFAGIIMAYNDISQIVELSSVIKRLQNDLFQEKKIGTKNGTRYHFYDIIGSSVKIKDTIKTAKKMAEGSSSILIVGATGTGKELFAQSIHNYSSVSEGPFVSINCSAVPETLIESMLFGTKKGAFTGALDSKGLFEQAQNGTIFLDELNSASLTFQASILRVIETGKLRRVGDNKEHQINARIISAMNTDPLVAINKKELRLDLYYRLSALTLELPTLSERLDDIDELVIDFIDKNNTILGRTIKGVSDEVLKILKSYNWPGNIRQLKHCIDYAMNMADMNDVLITSKHLPKYVLDNIRTKDILSSFSIKEDENLKETLKSVERMIIIDKLKKNNGNYSKTARELGISRQNFQYRIRVLNIIE